MAITIETAAREPTTHCPSPPRRQRDIVYIAAFVLLNLLVPALIVDLYPFSRAPMFADAPQVYCDYHLFDPDGHKLRPVDFGLRRNYWGNPVGLGVGYLPPQSVDRFGSVAGQEKITAAIQTRLRQLPSLAFVDVVQDVIGDKDGEHVGVLPNRTRRWRVDNPVFLGKKGP